MAKYTAQHVRKRRARYHLTQKSNQKPRLCVFRANTNIHVQLIDDTKRSTIVSASTLEKIVKKDLSNGGNVKAAHFIGQLIGKRALKEGVKDIVFDRGPYRYHGRVKALAEAAREAGLNF